MVIGWESSLCLMPTTYSDPNAKGHTSSLSTFAC